MTKHKIPKSDSPSAATQSRMMAEESDSNLELSGPANGTEAGREIITTEIEAIDSGPRISPLANDTCDIPHQQPPPPPPPPLAPVMKTQTSQSQTVQLPVQGLGAACHRMTQKELCLKLVPAVEKNELSTVLHLLKEGLQQDCIILFNKTPLTYAIELGHFDIAGALIQSGADVNIKEPIGSRRQPLHVAVSFTDLDVLPLLDNLVKRGADVDGRDGCGATPLMLASYIGRLDIVRFLQAHGTHFNASDFVGRTALHRATEGQHDDIIRFLVANGAHVDARDMFGWTAVYHSIVFGHIGTIKLLIACGISLNGTDQNNRSPLAVACNRLCPGNIRVVLSAALDHSKRERKIPTVALHSVLNTEYSMLLDLTILELLINSGARLHTTLLTVTASYRLCPSLKQPRKRVLLYYLLLSGCLRQQLEDTGTLLNPSAVLPFCLGELSSLKHLCRISIRTHLAVRSQCRDIQGAINTLPIPMSVKSFLSLSNFSDTCLGSFAILA